MCMDHIKIPRMNLHREPIMNCIETKDQNNSYISCVFQTDQVNGINMVPNKIFFLSSIFFHEKSNFL